MAQSVKQVNGTIVTVLAGLSLILIGLMAGFFYAYSASVMIGLEKTSDSVFIESMQWINATVRNQWFGPAFFGSLGVSFLAMLSALLLGFKRAAVWLALAFVMYAVAFAITVGISVPLNNELRDAGPVAQMADPTAVREAYEGTWVQWNVVRTVCSTIALAAMGGAVWQLGRDAR